MDTKKITRFEVIDHRDNAKEKGRVFVAYDVEVEIQVQDSEKTLKVFINNKKRK